MWLWGWIWQRLLCRVVVVVGAVLGGGIGVVVLVVVVLDLKILGGGSKQTRAKKGKKWGKWKKRKKRKQRRSDDRLVHLVHLLLLLQKKEGKRLRLGLRPSRVIREGGRALMDCTATNTVEEMEDVAVATAGVAEGVGITVVAVVVRL